MEWPRKRNLTSARSPGKVGRVDILFEIAVIFALLLANGVFAMAEIAVVSSKKTKLKALADAGDRKAARALALVESPSRFLATVQVGITLVGIVAGAYGGASLSGKLAPLLKNISFLAPYADGVAFVLVVALITYLSLIVGELVPKRLGLSNPERIASLLAGPMAVISSMARPLVSLLGSSTEGLLRICGFKDLPAASVSEEELRLLAREGLRVGVLHPAETEMLESVLALDKLKVRDLMTPRSKLIWVQEEEPHDKVWHKIVVSGHSTFPVYTTNRDRVAGVITVKAIYAHLAAGINVRIKDIMTEPFVVPASQNSLVLLETFKRTGRHLAVVVDEFGAVAGLVTLHDIMEAIVGDFPSMEKRLKPAAKKREDGSWLVDAMIPIEEFEAVVSDCPLDPASQRDYETFGGFVINRLGRLPAEGDTFQCGRYTVEIIDMDSHRVDKVLLLPGNRPEAKEAGTKTEAPA